MEYTKGEWKVVKQNDSEYDIVAETDDGFEFLGDVIKKEDAVLMSAAKDMYAALKYLCNNYCGMAGGTTCEDCPVGRVLLKVEGKGAT